MNRSISLLLELVIQIHQTRLLCWWVLQLYAVPIRTIANETKRISTDSSKHFTHHCPIEHVITFRHNTFNCSHFRRRTRCWYIDPLFQLLTLWTLLERMPEAKTTGWFLFPLRTTRSRLQKLPEPPRRHLCRLCWRGGRCVHWRNKRTTIGKCLRVFFLFPTRAVLDVLCSVHKYRSSMCNHYSKFHTTAWRKYHWCPSARFPVKLESVIK